MIKLLELKNFRGFKDAKLSGFSRVNVITGTNGSGKTSILEALFLISGAANASLSMSLSSFRGEGTLFSSSKSETPFRSLFRDLDPGITPVISSSNSILQTKVKKYFRELEIKPEYSVEEGQASTRQRKKLSGVEFVFKGPSGIEKNSWGWRTKIPKGVNINLPEADKDKPLLMLGGEPSKNPDLLQAHFVSPYFRDLILQDHKTLTILVKERRIQEVVEVLKIVHSSINDIQPLMEDDTPMIYADVGGSSLLPLSLLGAGVSNVLHILLPCVEHRNAIILIDEFEDGLHHSLFRPILKVVFSLAQKNNNQIFISSHSDEFLRVLASLAKDEDQQDLAFFRMNRRGMEGLIPRYSLSEVQEIMDSNLDIR